MRELKEHITQCTYPLTLVSKILSLLDLPSPLKSHFNIEDNVGYYSHDIYKPGSN